MPHFLHKIRDNANHRNGTTDLAGHRPKSHRYWRDGRRAHARGTSMRLEALLSNIVLVENLKE